MTDPAQRAESVKNVQSVQFVDVYSVPERGLRGPTKNQNRVHAVDNKS